MATQQQIDLALAYFTDREHTASYELLPGTGAVLVSAPHAVLQTRNGAVKCAERYTGMLCRLLHERAGAPVIYKTRNLGDDANFDPESDYRDALCRYLKRNRVRCVLDLHQMSPERGTELCIGTGHGQNLLGRPDLPERVAGCFRRYGLRDITLDVPFSAAGLHTVSATVAARCAVPALQLEFNTRLLMPGYDAYCFERVLDALCELCSALGDCAAG